MKVEDRGVKFPLTPGHEIAGEVEELGDKVSGFEKGERVLVYPWIGDGICPACKNSEENVCDSPQTVGIYQDGGYAEYVLVPHQKYLIKLNNLDLDSSASLACSGLTAFNAVKKSNVQEGENLVIVGAGGLGLMSIQIAKAITKSNVIVVDVEDKNLNEAKRMGADERINSGTTDVVRAIKDITNGNGCEAVVDFVNNSKTAPNSINMLRKRGRLIMVGLFGGSLELNLPLIPLRSFTLTGAYTGTFANLVELVNISQQGKIQSVVSRKFNLDDVNQALNDLKNRKIIGRAVINP
jgi:propanol-preferring alcohol dehydrogenase